MTPGCETVNDGKHFLIINFIIEFRSCKLPTDEGMIRSLAPVEGNALFQQIGDRNNDATVILNESSIEISESNESLNIQHTCGGRPRKDRVDFGRVHTDSLR